MTVPDPGEHRKSMHQGQAAQVHTCRCPVCGYEMPEPPATPCYTLRCPRCEAMMSGRPG